MNPNEPTSQGGHTAPDDGSHDAQPGASGDAGVTGELARLLPELAVTLYESAPHHHAAERPATEPLTGRQMEAVVFLARTGSATMGGFAAGLEISPAAASELVTRLLEKDVIRREADARDRRVVRVRLAARAEGYADEMLARWDLQLRTVFARFPGLDPDTLVAFLTALIDELKGRTAA